MSWLDISTLPALIAFTVLVVSQATAVYSYAGKRLHVSSSTRKQTLTALAGGMLEL